MFSQAFSLAVWESLFPACVVRGRANLLLSFHSAAPIPLQSLSVFSLLLAVAGQQEEAPSLFHISSPLKYPLDVVLPFSYIRGRFVYCPFFLVQFIFRARRLFIKHPLQDRRGAAKISFAARAARPFPISDCPVYALPPLCPAPCGHAACPQQAPGTPFSLHPLDKPAILHYNIADIYLTKQDRGGVRL